MSEDVTESFRSSLDDLKMNSKPQISMLTMLAEDHEQFASDIVRVIEDQIKKVPVSRKLPILYLIDSIVKNLSGTRYPQLFAQCIVPVFCGVFEEVDEKTRHAMYKLRQTWLDIIPNKQLYILDRKVQLMDPAWPITAKPPEHSVIHVNPKFLKPKEKEEQSPQFSPVHSDSSTDESIREELYAKEKELQKLRLELELAETKAKLEVQKKQLEQQALLKTNKNIINREPPPVIKLPPMGTTPAVTVPQQYNRDPRLYRDTATIRDPRLKKQQERQEQERLEVKKVEVVPAARASNVEPVSVPLSATSSSPRMDLATLLNSFSTVAAKVAAEHARKKNVPVEADVLAKSSELHSHGMSSETHSHRSPDTVLRRESPETVLNSPEHHSQSPEHHHTQIESIERHIKRKSPEKVPQRKSPETFSQRKSPENFSQRKSPENFSQRKSPELQLKDIEAVFEDETDVSDKKVELQSRMEPSNVSAQTQKFSEPKNTSAKVKDKRSEEKDSKRDKKWSPHGKDKEKSSSSRDKDKRDSKDSSRKDSKDRDKRDRRESKDSERSRERRNSRERRSDGDGNRHGERRPYRHSEPEFKRGSYRDTRDNRTRGRGRHTGAIHSADGRTDQFGRMLRRSKSGSRSRDRSPIDRDKERTGRSPKEATKDDKSRSERLSRDTQVVNETLLPENEGIVENLDVMIDEGVYRVPDAEPIIKAEFLSKDENIVDHMSYDRSSNASPIKEEAQNENGFIQEKMEHDVRNPSPTDVKVLGHLAVKQEVADGVMTSSEDVDMRVQQQELKVSKLEVAEAGRPDKGPNGPVRAGDLQAVVNVKRPYPETLDPKPDLRPYKIPKLGAKKVEAKVNDSREDISKLFGEQDVDYRHPLPTAPAQPTQTPTPNQNFLPVSGINIKSPAQRRWSQFKESHPDDFAQDMERKRLRDAQMQSMITDVQDVDLRPLTSSRQQRPPLPMPPLDVSGPIPKDLSVENQEQILQRAEQELKEGRISHGDHQEIVRQLGQVYDIQKKRHNFDERSSRVLDLRDPRLRGIRETKSPYPGDRDIDRRLLYHNDVETHRKVGPRAHVSSSVGDISDPPSELSPRYREKRENYRASFEMSPKEDFDARRPLHSRARHEHPIEYERRRGVVDDFDGRSPKEMDAAQAQSHRDYDRASLRYADYDGRRPRDVDRINEMPPHDIDARHPRCTEDEHRGDFRGENFRGSFDEFSRPNHMRGPPLRGEMQPRDVRDERMEELHGVRHKSPPSEGPFRAPPEDLEGHRPFGSSTSHPREPFGGQGPRHGPVQDIRGPRPNFPTSGVRPEPRMPAALGPRPLVPAGAGPSPQTGGISDPMDDPRWSAMRGLLDNDGTEELVIDGKPFELRMGTSRKLRIYGKVMDVAVDLKERGIRIDGQLVYKLGEPIKEVPAVGKTVRLYYHGLPKPIWLDGQQHEMRVDAPPRNVVVDDVRRGFQIDGRDMMILVDRLEKGLYGGPPRKIRIAGVDHDIAFQPPPRRILIDNKSCELKLDSKIPYVIIDGKPHGIRFDGEPRTVFINDQPFTVPVDRAEKIRIGHRPTYIAFGGPAHEIIIDGKWFEVKFDNIPKDIQLGNRHFSIRIPGPLPRVKILDELPPNFDDSRLMSSNPASVPQPRPLAPGFPESAVTGPVPQCSPFLQGHDTGPQVPEGIRPLVAQGIDSMHPQKPPEGLVTAHIPDVIHPVAQPGIDNIRPNLTAASEGTLRPIGTLNPEAIRFGQPAVQVVPQPKQPIISQPGATPNLLQPSSLRHGSNPILGLPRPNLIGFPGLASGLQNQRILSQTQPVNMIAQGLINQVASNMMTSTLQNLPDFAASLRALTQLNAAQPPPTLPPQMQVHRHPQEDDHGAAMVTGMQGSSFVGQQKLPGMLPLKPSGPVLPVATIAPTLPMMAPLSLPGLMASQVTAARPAVTTISSTIPGLSQPSTAIETKLFSSSTSAAASIDINNLLSKLLQAGLIKEPAKADMPPAEKSAVSAVETPAPVKEKSSAPSKKPGYVPDMTDFDSDKLKQMHATVIEQLHEGVQCHTCAVRFTLGDHEKYRAHLDWHFRQNKLEQEMVKVAKNRKWFYSIPDWIQYEELEDTIEKSRSEIFEQMRTGESTITSAAHALSVRALEGKEVVKNPVASGIEGEDVCATCGDPFDQMWNEDTEEWILKNTIKVDGKTYHPVCYEDAQETPTPVTVPTKNPLELEIQGIPRPADGGDSSSLPKVEIKMEAMDSTPVALVPSSEPAALNVPVKSELIAEDASLDKSSSLQDVKSADIVTGLDISVPASQPVTEAVTCAVPTLLSTIATTVVREVIPVSHEDPMSPWEMDSNPTPELSRTPTPEPIQSFTPAQSMSSESISSLAQGSDGLTSEEPIPPALASASALPGLNKPAEGPSAAGRSDSK